MKIRSNPEKLMATVHTYTCPAGKSFPVILLDKHDGKAVCLAVGSIPLMLTENRLKLGAVLQ